MENKVLAIVAGNEIKDKDLDTVLNRYPQERRAMFQGEQGREALLEQVVAFELMRNFGKELKIDETEEYKNLVEGLAKEALTQLAINKVLADVTVTDEDVKKYYDDNSSMFINPPTVSAKHILVKTEEEATSIKEEIANGLAFEEAAKKYSTCPSKEQGGSLGNFGKGSMVPEFEKVAFESEVGKVSEPVKTQFGYHLILVEDKTESTTVPFDQVKDAVLKQLINERQQNKYLEMIKQLSDKYGVERK
ncbi:peptidylprolyl isomerase [Clostridium botulinum]|uniref:Foldase protein PrsA n=1 Tax=Clostridium botulinum (strain Eklund 17B / Type B) TaxID=935198 RepID=B2TQZ8_CLOBB|nr:peptidylprolyl isomerase [Clostridium sp. ZBS18]ACD22583.1 foldase protein PrsA [Clostridium botulinum B str. Eklund 17B (NRP)]MBN1056691.1 peptidylprolyl isomerase [Clostridium botulinum]MBY6975741.1 peptidylprolyl isomerase [Clostridium botulinum]MBY7001290.1 peptidylprolyl isomerase [Clostridium botulinum]MCR1274057.1 peptidylprolyl isomerase [Clostridium botulinum]